MDLLEIENKITELEQQGTNWENCEKLHILYNLRQGLTGQPITARMRSEEPTSDIIEAIEAATWEDVKPVLDEHFTAIRALYPKEYNLILKKIRGAS